MSAMGLGRVKTLQPDAQVERLLGVDGSGYARIAAMSGWIRIMFISLVRL
jgi:hypothetical protein